MGFSKLKTGAQAPAATTTPKTVAAAPPPAAVVAKEPEVVKDATVVTETETETETATAAPATTTSRAVSVFGGGSAAAALMAVTEMQDAAPAGFPVLELSGGNSGGMFAPKDFVPEEIANQLPQGKKPIDCVFMGYRTAMAAWPVGFLDKQEGDKPVYSLAVSCADADGARLVGTAAQAYQFTKGVNKKAWDHAGSGLGHIKPALELLVYLPAVDDVIVVTTPPHYTSWKSTMENLKKLLDPKSGQLAQQPCQLRPISTGKTINGNAITEHVIDFNVIATETGAAWYKSYANYIQQAAADAEVREKIENWVNCVDRPLTDDLRALLRKAGSFKP